MATYVCPEEEPKKPDTAVLEGAKQPGRDLHTSILDLADMLFEGSLVVHDNP